MKSFKDIFEEFIDLGDRYSIDLIDGLHIEGYPEEIRKRSFSYYSGGTMASDKPFEFKFEDVDMNKLYFFKFSEPGWKKASWDNESNVWIITNCGICFV